LEDRPLEDWEYPEPDEADDGDFSETRPCPSCGASIYEDTERCPICGDYIVASSAALAGWPWWFIVLGLIGLVAVILVLGGLR